MDRKPLRATGSLVNNIPMGNTINADNFFYNNQTPGNFSVPKVFWIPLVLNKLLHNACQTHDKMLHQSEPYRPYA